MDKTTAAERRQQKEQRRHVGSKGDRAMKEIWDIAVYTARRNDGKWVAATDSSPYFYLEADSEPSVLEAARRALVTYQGALPILHNLLDGERKTISTPTYSHEKTIRGRELVA
jgi:hypothetical protein